MGLVLVVCAVRCWRLEGARLLGDDDRLGEAVDACEDAVASYLFLLSDTYKNDGAKKEGKSDDLSSLSSGGRTRTSDLWVMSPTSCQLLHSAIIRFRNSLLGSGSIAPPL